MRMQLRKAQAAEEIMETGLGAKRVGDGVDGQVNEAVIAFAVGFVEPVQGAARIAQAGVDRREVQRERDRRER